MRAAPRAVQDLPSNPAARFTAAHRLLRKEGFDRVLHAESLADRHFKVFFARNNNNNARLGIVASKRTLPHATDRNRIKRVIREVFRQHRIKVRHLDLVVMVRRACAEGAPGKGLETLFNRVESKCAEL
jgi:ribonuclease P protein component